MNLLHFPVVVYLAMFTLVVPSGMKERYSTHDSTREACSICNLSDSIGSSGIETIYRSCHGYYRLSFDSYSFDAGYFEIRRGCGETVPNSCRERARDGGHNVMRHHMNNGIPTTKFLKDQGAKGYWVRDMKSFVEGEVCDFLKWNKIQKKGPFQVRVTAVTAGISPCAKETLLGTFSISCSGSLSTQSNTPLVAQSRNTRILRFPHSGQVTERFAEVVQFGRSAGASTGSYSVGLFESEAAASNGNIFAPYSTGDQTYQGCGVKTGQNVLRYFGINMTQTEINKDRYIPGRKVEVLGVALHGNKFTAPSELRSGLSALLQERGITNIEVVRESNKRAEDIPSLLASGYPVIALVDGGNHWVTVVAVKSSFFSSDPKNQMFFVHNNGSTEWRSWAEMSLEFTDFNSKVSALGNAANIRFTGGTSYLPGTLIYFRKSRT